MSCRSRWNSPLPIHPPIDGVDSKFGTDVSQDNELTN